MCWGKTTMNLTSESVWQTWKAWEFGQKQAPSRWLTLLAHRILARSQPAPQRPELDILA
jgi:hypothetical protein